MLLFASQAILLDGSLEGGMMIGILWEVWCWWGYILKMGWILMFWITRQSQIFHYGMMPRMLYISF